jgi:UDP-N-acetylmuramoylalanine--D-glutamate ligase
LDYTSRLELFAGVITNISPDHLDRYDNYEAYIASKLSIYPYCKNVIINLDEPLLRDLEGDSYFSLEKNHSNCVFSARKVGSSYEVFFKEQLIITSNELLVVGRHNIENLLAALSLGFQFGMPIERMIEAAKRFKGLPHRLEFITSINEVDFYNDSKSTNAISTKSAIISLLEKYSHLVLILGGIAKQEDYSELFALISEKIETVVLIGESTRIFSEEIASPVVKNARTMDEAVSLSKSLAKGGAILLSPACASFDMFLDFNDRGDQFKYYVTGGNQLPS